MKVLTINQSGDRIPQQWLEKWVKALTKELKSLRFQVSTRQELVLVFVNSGEIRRLNRLYRRKDYSTDILSFGSADPGCLGELVLCLPVLRRQSRRTGLSERGELGYMVVHGVLHLLGFDHLHKDEEIRMFSLQDQLFSRLESRIGYR